MNDAPYKPDYTPDAPPAAGEAQEVAPGVQWLRMPLPFKLDHINLWLLDDRDDDIAQGGDGWTIVDTGIATDDVKAAWEKIFEGRFTKKKPLKRVIVTHFHPDHVGLAGWLTERFQVPLWMPRAEWTWGRMLSLETRDSLLPGFRRFYRQAGFDESMMEAVEARAGRYAGVVSPIPPGFRAIGDGDLIGINGRDWRVVVGAGHSPEHACLYCESLGVLIGGDQVLPRISPNVSVWPQEPDADPLKLFLDSLERFRGIGPETLVLPSHDRPYRGLHGRLDDLAGHHRDRLEETFAALASPATGVEVLSQLFRRELDNHQLFFAIGEALAHLHRLMAEGRAIREAGPGGVWRYKRL